MNKVHNRFFRFCRTVVTGLWPRFRVRRAFHRVKLALFNLMLSFITIEENERERRRKYGKAVAQIANGFSYVLVIIIILTVAPGSFALIITFIIGSNM